MTNIFFIDLYAYFFLISPLKNSSTTHFWVTAHQLRNADLQRLEWQEENHCWNTAELKVALQFLDSELNTSACRISHFLFVQKKKHLRRFIRENTLAFVEKVRRSRAMSTLAGHRRAFTSQSSLFSSPERLWGFDLPVEHVCDLVFSSLDFSLSGVRNPQPACWWKCTSRPVHRRRTAVHSDSFHRRFPSQFQRTLRYRGKKKTGNSLLSVSDVRFAWVFPLERWAQGRWMLLIGFNPLMWKCSLEQAHLHLAPSEVADSLQ